MLVKVETQWRYEDTEEVQNEEELVREHVCVRGGTRARKARRKEIGGRKESETLIVCANTLTLGRHVDSILYLDDTIHKTFRAKGRTQKLVIRNALNSWSAIFGVRTRLFRISHGETSVPSTS